MPAFSTRFIHSSLTLCNLGLVPFFERRRKAAMPVIRKVSSERRTLFPDSGGPVENTLFSFVHLDVDLYQSMSDSLQFFYSRMVPGGIILCHDFGSIHAVTRAVEEFFSDKPEPVIELSGNQCLIVKLGSSVS